MTTIIKVGKQNVNFQMTTQTYAPDLYWVLSTISDKIAKKNFGKSGSMIEENAQIFQITGLNETKMADLMVKAEVNFVDKEEVFKGTRFGGKSYNIFGAYAMVLKHGLPPGLDVHLNVKFKWTSRDLARYILLIKEKTGQL